MIFSYPPARRCFFLFFIICLAPSISSARFTDIDFENSRFCGLLANGAAECVGGDFTDLSAILADPNQQYTTVQSGNNYTCGITISGTINCWGDGPEGQTEPPVFDNPVTRLSVGPFHACAIDSLSNAKCWGQNIHGQTEPPVPNNNFVDVEAFGIYASCGVKQSGEVLCWGRDETTYFLPNFELSSGSPVSEIHAIERFGNSGPDQIRCVTRQDETLQCFMNNRGDQVVTELSNGPYKKVELFRADGGVSICALTFNSELDCARIVNGNGTTDSIPVAVERSSISYSAMTTGFSRIYAVTMDGRLTALDTSFNPIGENSSNSIVNIINGELNLPVIAIDGADFYGENVGLELFFDVQQSARTIDTQIFRDGVLLETTDNSRSYMDTTVEPNREYSYALRAIHRFGQLGELSQPLIISTSISPPEDASNQPVPGEASRPNKPMGLRAEVYWYDVELFWDRNLSGQVEKYEIRRNGELVGVSRGTSWYDDSTVNGQQYQFDVIALGRNDEFLGMESTNVQIGALECADQNQ